ncbi:MAG: hypothetical protein KC421_07105 [Anaerolineales bacterium]|nr:hypothetical protein [Anaerolineales bacterium]
MFKQMAFEDFWRAYRHGYWRKLASWILGTNNQLLPYHEIRDSLPFQGQRDLGAQTIPIENIVGSVGRYRDFDRAFLPTQRYNHQRWINISLARYQSVELPPIDVYKIGEVYFVKDGNHRVSVARQRGQSMIDANVIEIEVPISITPESEIDEILSRQAYAQFLQKTNLLQLRPDADLEMTLVQLYGRLLEHINTHRYYMGLEQQQEISYEEAVLSWYDHVYCPLILAIKQQNLPAHLPEMSLTDLYLMVSEYQWLRRESSITDDKVEEASKQLSHIYSAKDVRQTLRKLRQANWIDEMILTREKADFYAYTHIRTLRPDADLTLTLPGKYEKMLAHISEHRWFLGEKQGAEVSYEEAVTSWYDHVYLPIVHIIREQKYLSKFPDRAEADLYLWTIDHRQDMGDAIMEQLES